MTAVYTVAAMPQGDRFSDRPVPLPVKMPYTLADAEEMAKKYNENPVYKGILRNHRFSHFVPFNIEALTINRIPDYGLPAIGTVIREADGSEWEIDPYA